MGKIPEHILQEIKDRVSIRELVEDYVSLKKDGVNFKGLCPFHQEKTPSFKVHEGKGIYKCFGCGESGNVFGFLMKMEGMSFAESAERLAARAGISLPRVQETPEEREKSEVQERLFAANRSAAGFYAETLRESPAAAVAREYLQKRLMSPETVARYGLGFSPDSFSATSEQLQARGLKLEELHGAGLVIPRDTGGYYDRFRGRLMFPILDVQGRVRGFGARQLKDEPDQPKYINSPETPIYKKGAGFYGLYQAKDAIRREGRAVIVEGYFDQIALDQAGIKCAVATLGTALTPEHAQLLRRYAAEVFLVFDADEAGKKASLRALETFLDCGITPRIIAVPEGKDPDEYLRNHAGEDFQKLFSEAPPLLSYYLEQALAGPGATPGELAKSVNAAAQMVARVQDPIERRLFADQLSRKSGVPLWQVEARLTKPKTRPESAAPTAAPSGNQADLEYPPAEMDLCRLLVHHPEIADRVREKSAVGQFSHPGLRDFVETLMQQQEERGRADSAALLHQLSDPGLRARIAQWEFENDPFAGAVETALADTIRKLFRNELRSRLDRIPLEIAEAKKEGDERKMLKLLEEHKALQAELWE